MFRRTARSGGQCRPLGRPALSGVALTGASTVRDLMMRRGSIRRELVRNYGDRDRCPDGLRRRKSAQPSGSEAEPGRA